jgi:competence protein ComEA
MHSLTPRQVALWALAALVILALGWRELGGSGASASSYSPPTSTSSATSAGALPHADPVVVVDVAGAVRHPGVYRLPTGARVLDAVRRAVPMRGAQLGAINLAERLADGEQVVVPARGAPAPTGSPGGSGGAAAPDAIVHLNSATLEQLETLDGIGPALAQRIVDYRSAHGGFRSLAELDQVSGIGPARLAALHGHVAL